MLKQIFLLHLMVFSVWAADLTPCMTKIALVATAEKPKPALAPLLIISGPSGAGKTTVLKKVIEGSERELHTAVAVTTRSPRPGEVDGKDYHFWTKEKFEAAVKNGEFLEYAGVHGNSYGTLRSEVDPYREKGIGVILNIDVQGAAKIREEVPDAVSVFLKTSSNATFEARLRARGTETEEAIQKRLKNAKEELKHEHEYTHTVINDDLDTAVKDFQKVLVESYAPYKK